MSFTHKGVVEAEKGRFGQFKPSEAAPRDCLRNFCYADFGYSLAHPKTFFAACSTMMLPE